jgi:membrane glycosyltransferase
MELYRSAGVIGSDAESAQPAAVPPLARSSLRAQSWGRLGLLAWLLRRESPPADIEGPACGAGHARRWALLMLSLAPALYATYVMSGLMPAAASSWPEKALLALFAVLSCWVAAGFWTAMMGFWVLLRGDRHLISRSVARPGPLPAAARTAIVMPICNEDVQRVFAGLRATVESVGAAGALDHFDFFVLSDTSRADTVVAELDAWGALRDRLGSGVRLFYRHRRRRVKRKSGNLDDFCRRWGARYRYLVVLDADSVMTGDCLTTLVQLMESRPDAGIIQTAPRAVGRDTLHARMQQFANHVYAPVFTAGLHYWQLGESHYWGHNAIIRMRPFMDHCVLAPLPGEGALAGDILSHDFVEAALMRRAGYGVWIAYDLAGSYEETPPNVLDEVKRDRRWCHGNLMNARLTFARGMHPVHRSVFFTGALAYVTAPLWFGFLALSSWLLVTHAGTEPEYFVVPHQLFPLWPSWRPEQTLALFAAVASVLFLPKIIAALIAGIRNPQAFGGRGKLAMSLLIEIVLSALLAPVRMLFHTQFVVAALAGWDIQWRSPARADRATSWREAVHRHGWQSSVGVGWVAVMWLHAPQFLPWLAPVATGLILAIPLSVWTSRASAGIRARSRGLFLTPSEIAPPPEIVASACYAGSARPAPSFADAFVDPDVRASAAAHAQVQRTALAGRARAERVSRALFQGPSALSEAEKLLVLGDRQALAELSHALRTGRAHPAWTAQAANAPRATIHRFGPKPALRGAQLAVAATLGTLAPCSASDRAS